jgi:SSS family solute:Na+ symporter
MLGFFMKNPQLLYWAVFIAYSLAMVAVGFWAAKRAKADDGDPSRNTSFWLAGRTLPGWWLGASLTSGWLMLGWIAFGMAQIYTYGVTGLWLLQIPWLLLCIALPFLVPLYRKIPAISVPQSIQRRFGGNLRAWMALCCFAVFLCWTGAELYIIKVLCPGFLGMGGHENLVLVLFILPMIVYTLMGGFRACVATDVIQFGIMAVFMVILAGWAVMQASTAAGDAGIIAALQQAAAKPVMPDTPRSFNLMNNGWIFPVMLLVGYLPGWFIEQDLAVRMQAAETTRSARQGAWTAAILISVFVIILPAIAAFCAIIVFPAGSEAGKAIAVNAEYTRIVAGYIEQMPTGLALFMFTGILACQMSTVDTFANVTALALGYDLARGDTMRNPRIRRAFMLGTTLAAFLGALVYAVFADKLGDVYYLSSGVLSGCVAVPAIAIFWRRANAAGIWVGSLAGLVATFACYWYEYKYLSLTDAASPLYYTKVLPGWLAGAGGYLYIGAGVIAAAIATVVVSLAYGAIRQTQAYAGCELLDAPVADGVVPIAEVSDPTL